MPMIFEICNIPIYFPYNSIYPEQLEYIKSLIESLGSKGHILIEMPSGTGKTISLLSATVSYLIFCRKTKKPFQIVYCSRTLQEISKALQELKNLINYIKKYVEFDFLGVGLSAKRNMCINETALKGNVELICKKMINRLENTKCDFYENKTYKIPNGVYDFEDLKKMGRKEGFCPYYLVRDVLTECDCIIYPYNYIIDPVISNIVSKKLTEECCVIFDEAHNIDSHCIESLSLEIDRSTLENAGGLLRKLEHEIAIKKSEAQKDLREKLMKDFKDEVFPYYFSPEKPINGFASREETKYEYAPGNLRNSNHFISTMKRFVEFIKTKLKTTHLTAETIKSFLNSVEELTFIDKNTLKFTSCRLSLLIEETGLQDENFPDLRKIAKFATMLAVYKNGFSVIFEPYDSMASVFNPILRFYCMDSSVAMKSIFDKFKNVIITSGTLSPIEMYPKILNFVPTKIVEIGATLDRNSISPLVITKGDDQMLLQSEANRETGNLEEMEQTNKLTTSFALRIDPSVIRNYGSLLISLSKTVPDNIVVFFPSYIYMEEIVSIWSETEIINEILKNKLLFIETPDQRETEVALKNYRNACESGRGAILLCVARGKVSEGVDFEDGYGRAVVMLGVPFMYTESVRLKERLKYLKKEYGIKEYDFLVFDAMRHAAQCLGRVMRKKSDYGLMILADHRFGSDNKLTKLPKWIQQRIEKGNTGLSIDMAMSIAKHFYKEMAQQIEIEGVSLLNEDDAINFLTK
ncbi:rad15 [Nucleospora cyclopteri]